MAGVKPRHSCENLFKKLKILTLSCEYILSLMIFTVKTKNCFHLILLYTLSTQRIKICFKRQLPASLVSRRVHIMLGIKIFNSLPSNITALIDKQAQFKVALKRYFITHSFYSVEEFMLSDNSECR
jgi:hypothetical protein